MKLIIPVILGIITGALAARKNRSAIGWGIFGTICPLITLIVLAFMSKLPKDSEK